MEIINKIFKKYRGFLFLPAIFIVGFFLFNYFPKNIKIEDIQYIKISGQKIKVDLALTSETRARGLSGRAVLKEDEGMLFVFENVDKYKFWMKDMNFPIDIIWIDENQKVVYIQKNATPESYPETFGGEQNSKYVLEVVSGFSEQSDLKEGDKVSFE